MYVYTGLNKHLFSIKDLHFRVFDNPPVVDVFEAIASDLLLG